MGNSDEGDFTFDFAIADEVYEKTGQSNNVDRSKTQIKFNNSLLKRLPAFGFNVFWNNRQDREL